MKTINLSQHWQKIAIAILLVIVLMQCNSNDTNVKLAKQTLKEKIKNANTKINASAEQNKVKDLAILAEQKKVDSIISINKKLRLTKSVKSNIVKSNQIKAKSFSNTQIESYFVNRYELPNEVKSSLNGLELSENISKLTIVDLIGGDGAIEQLELTNKELINTQNIVFFKDGIITEYKGKENNYISMLSLKDTVIDAQENHIKLVEKSLRKEKRNKNLYKITTVVAILGGTYLLVK